MLMETQIHNLAILYGRNRGEIIQCLKKTTALHEFSFLEVVKIVSEYQPPPTPVSWEPQKETPKEANLKRLKRARDIGTKRHMDTIRTAYEPEELAEAFKGMYEFMGHPIFYDIEFTDEILNKLLRTLRGRLAGIHGHRITESSIRTSVAKVLIDHQAPIEKVMETMFSSVPTREEMDALYHLGKRIKYQNKYHTIEGYDKRDLEVIIKRLLTISEDLKSMKT